MNCVVEGSTNDGDDKSNDNKAHQKRNIRSTVPDTI